MWRVPVDQSCFESIEFSGMQPHIDKKTGEQQRRSDGVPYYDIACEVKIVDVFMPDVMKVKVPFEKVPQIEKNAQLKFVGLFAGAFARGESGELWFAAEKVVRVRDGQ